MAPPGGGANFIYCGVELGSVGPEKVRRGLGSWSSDNCEDGGLGVGSAVPIRPTAPTETELRLFMYSGRVQETLEKKRNKKSAVLVFIILYL